MPTSRISNLAAIDTARIGDSVRIDPFACIQRGAEVGADCVIHSHVLVSEGARIGDGCILEAGAVVGPAAVIEPRCRIGSHSVIHAGCVVGEGSIIDESCVIGVRGQPAPSHPLRIGSRSIIRSHSVVYSGSVLGEELETGHHVVIREGTKIGRNLRIGSFSDVEGGCTIGDYCRFHGYVHVGKGAAIGDFVWLYSLTTLLNDPLPPSRVCAPVTIGDGSVVCVGATVMPDARVGTGAFIAAGSIVSGEVPSGAIVAGGDGTISGHVTNLVHLRSGTRHPWMRHFANAYPASAGPRISALLDDILATKFAKGPTGTSE